jgi:hypothetical protein
MYKVKVFFRVNREMHLHTAALEYYVIFICKKPERAIGTKMVFTGAGKMGLVLTEFYPQQYKHGQVLKLWNLRASFRIQRR